MCNDWPRLRDLRVALCGEKEIIYDQVQFVFKIYLKLDWDWFFLNWIRHEEGVGRCGCQVRQVPFSSFVLYEWKAIQRRESWPRGCLLLSFSPFQSRLKCTSALPAGPAVALKAPPFSISKRQRGIISFSACMSSFSALTSLFSNLREVFDFGWTWG